VLKARKWIEWLVRASNLESGYGHCISVFCASVGESPKSPESAFQAQRAVSRILLVHLALFVETSFQSMCKQSDGQISITSFVHLAGIDSTISRAHRVDTSGTRLPHFLTPVLSA